MQDVQPGDRVLTFDHAMQMVVDVRREIIWPDMPTLMAAPRRVVIPEGAFNNYRDLLLMPDQGLLVESDMALGAQYDPFAAVPARALDGFQQIQSVVLAAPMRIATLVLNRTCQLMTKAG
ncbi:MAG: Hint domain-containing protein [Pseudomonadota bacterium]